MRRSDVPQDEVTLREPLLSTPLIPRRSRALAVAVSLPLIGYTYWYYRATSDAHLLLGRRANPWPWVVMVFPGVLLVLPYAYAQAKLVARVEVATGRAFSSAAYVLLCLTGFVLPAVLAFVLQARLNEAAIRQHEVLRSDQLAVGSS
jgi:hypothetical protein